MQAVGVRVSLAAPKSVSGEYGEIWIGSEMVVPH
jgi:hypothetical protein